MRKIDKIKYIRIKTENEDNYSEDIPIGANAQNIDMQNGNNLQDTIGNLDIDNNDNITEQLISLRNTTNQLNNNKLNKSDATNYVPPVVTNWLNNNVNPVGSAVTIDKSLSIEGSAADAKATGNNFALLYSSTSIYYKNDYVLYNGNIYRCKEDILTPEEWTSNHWILINITNDISGLYSSTKKLFNNFEYGRVYNNTTLFTINNVHVDETVYYHIIADIDFYGLIDLYNINNERIAAYGKKNVSSSIIEYSGEIKIPSTFSYAKVTAYKTGVNGSIKIIWLSKNKEPINEIEDINDEIEDIHDEIEDINGEIEDIHEESYYIGRETLTATSTNKMSNHGEILLKGGNYYKIMCQVSPTSNRYRFFLWKTTTNAVDTSYYVDIIPANNEVMIHPDVDSYLVTYNIDNLSSLTISPYLFEYRQYQLTEVIKTYYVSKTVSYNDKHHYTSLTQCLLDLKDDETNKLIYIEGGEYDIYQEYVNANVPIPPNGTNPSNYWNYNVWVPKNTHLIGRGIVKLIWEPSTTQTTETQSKIVSPLNVAASCTIENIEVYCKNGRYCLHNDPLNNVKYIGAIQIFKNCKFYKKINDDTYGTTMTTGFAASARQQHIYEDCEFYNENSNSAFYGHSRVSVGPWDITELNSSNILLKNCLLVTPFTYSVRLDNTETNKPHIKIKFENCYISSNIRINSAGNYSNGFDVLILNCNNNISVTGDYGNYLPKIYPPSS